MTNHNHSHASPVIASTHHSLRRLAACAAALFAVVALVVAASGIGAAAEATASPLMKKATVWDLLQLDDQSSLVDTYTNTYEDTQVYGDTQVHGNNQTYPDAQGYENYGYGDTQGYGDTNAYTDTQAYPDAQGYGNYNGYGQDYAPTSNQNSGGAADNGATGQNLTADPNTTAPTSGNGTATSNAITLPAAKAGATVLVYLNGSDLESEAGEASADIAEMLQSGIGSNANVVIQTLGTRMWHGFGIASDHTQRYAVQQGRLQLVDDTLGQLDTTSAQTLSDFISWGTQNFPADRYILLFWDHGAGPVYGFGYDEFQGDYAALTLDEIQQALKQNSDVHFDLIGMDCCIMSSLETCYVLSPYCDYMALSEDFEPGIGWSYAHWMSVLENDPSVSTEELGTTIVDDMILAVESNPANGDATLALIDSAKVPALYDAWVSFAYANEDALMGTNYSHEMEWQELPTTSYDAPTNGNGYDNGNGDGTGYDTDTGYDTGTGNDAQTNANGSDLLNDYVTDLLNSYGIQVTDGKGAQGTDDNAALTTNTTQANGKGTQTTNANGSDLLNNYVTDLLNGYGIQLTNGYGTGSDYEMLYDDGSATGSDDGYEMPYDGSATGYANPYGGNSYDGYGTGYDYGTGYGFDNGTGLGDGYDMLNDYGYATPYGTDYGYGTGYGFDYGYGTGYGFDYGYGYGTGYGFDYGYGLGDISSFWDLWDLDMSYVTMTDYFVTDIMEVASSVSNAEATALAEAVSNAIVHYGCTSGETGLTGMGVTLPYGDAEFYDQLEQVFKACGIDATYVDWLEGFVGASGVENQYDHDTFADTWEGWDYYLEDLPYAA